MRTNELHASAKQVQRSSGRSSVAAAAYRSGEMLYDERTGLTHDYTKKGGVEFKRLYLPDNAPDHLNDRAALWNAVELKENRKNSCTAREFEIAFPHEFNAMQRREAGDMIAKEIMRRYNAAVDIAYHHPNREGDERNFHAHILFTTRGFDPDTKDGWAKNKYRDLNNDKMEVDGESTTKGKAEVHSLRKFTADEMNRIAQRDKLDVKTEHLSFEARGIDKQPTKRMGWLATQLERRGVKTERGDINRAIIASNDNMGSTTAQLSDQKRVLLFELQRSLLALEQEDGARFSGNKIASLGREGESFPFHQKRVEQAQEGLIKAKEQLSSMSVIDRMIGKKAAFEAEIQSKETNLQEAQQELEDIKHKAVPQIDELEEQRRVNAVRTAQYKQEQGEAQTLRAQLENRNNIEKIIGAITGKTREQNERLEEIEQRNKTYEADKRLEEIRAKQIEQARRDRIAKERDEGKANDNAVDVGADITQAPSTQDRKDEFLERMAKERAEREKEELEFKKETEINEDQKAEVHEENDVQSRKEAFLQRMQEERNMEPPENKKDKERE